MNGIQLAMGNKQLAIGNGQFAIGKGSRIAGYPIIGLPMPVRE
jgi:hypothetical protein